MSYKNKLEKYHLIQLQSLPLDMKIIKSLKSIREWYEFNNGNVYVAFSGGKDSTVLLHLVRSLYKDVLGVFVQTMEYPQVNQFVRSTDNIKILKPSMSFKEVINKYGYPIISKSNASAIRKLRTQNLSDRYRNYLLNGDERGSIGMLAKKHQYLLKAPFKISEQCCDVFKKRPFAKFEKETNLKPFIATMSCESSNRERAYLKFGCNAFTSKVPKSTPLGFWTENDILEYLVKFNVDYSSIYGDIKIDDRGRYYNTGEKRTGCVACLFGIHLEKYPNRIQRLKHINRALYDYYLYKLGYKKVLEFMNIDYE